MTVEQIVQSVKELEERFLDKDVDTGDPADDVDTGPMGDSETYNELEAFTTLVSNSAINCSVGIEQMLRGHKEEIAKLHGEDAESVLRQAQEVLQGIADLFDTDIEDDDIDTDDSEDTEEPVEPNTHKERPPEVEAEPDDDRDN